MVKKFMKKFLCGKGIHWYEWRWSTNKVLDKSGTNYLFGTCKNCGAVKHERI